MANRYTKNPLVAKVKEQFFKYAGIKESTATTYAHSINYFCQHYELTPFTLLELPLEDIEDKTERYIRAMKTKIAPKRLNVIYSAIKSWLWLNKKIKSKKMFREIAFDKTSRKMRDVPLPDKQFLRQLCDNADLREKLVVAFYGVYAVRPSLIPQLKIEDIYHKDIEINEDGTVKLSNIVWIWCKREYKGNKGNIDFPIILTSETSEWLESYLNQRARKEKLTPKSVLIDVKTKANVDRIVAKLFDCVGFKGRKYLLRHLGSKLLKRAYDDEGLKEWLCGHKGGISATYEHSGHTLSDWEIRDYKSQLSERELLIYGISKNEQQIIDAKTDMARTLLKEHFSETEYKAILRGLREGKMTFKQFNEKFDEIIKTAMDNKIENKFEELFVKYNNKHNNNK